MSAALAPERGRLVLLWLANLLGAIAFAWPFLLPAAIGGDAAHEVDAPVIIVGLLICLGGLLFIQLGRGGMGPQAVALIGILGAMLVVLRLPGFVAGFSALFLPVLVAGNSFGPGFGFVMGATGMFASGLFIGGFGPWLPFEMVAVGWVGMGAGFVPHGSSWRARIGWLALYGAVTGFLYGAVMNLWSWPYIAGSSGVGWAPELGALANLEHYVTYYVTTSAGWDLFRAVGNAAMVLVLGRPLLGALDRAAKRMSVRLGPIAPPTSRGGAQNS
jgi:energy-coupling factor transport system substrate-specific component